jgi:glutaredoxin
MHQEVTMMKSAINPAPRLAMQRFQIAGTLVVAVALALTCAAAHAQLYKWVGADGKVNYTDTPPPPTAKAAERKAFADGGSSPVEGKLPFDLEQAVNNHPVTLYTTGNCPPCDEARTLLITRGVPFAEKTVSSQEDINQLKQAGGAGQLPFLLVGRATQQGMESGLYTSILNAAGYPDSNKLPRTYKNPPAEAATPAPKALAGKLDPKADPDKKAATAIRNGPETLPPAVGNVPPGFRF